MNIIPDNVKQFIERYNHNLNINDDVPHFNNIYHVISKDVNGEITEEKFGVNVITDNGLEFIATNKFFNWFQSHVPEMRIGTGTSAIDPSSSQLEELVASADCTYARMSLNTTTPLVYDSVTGLVTAHSLTLQADFDYVLPNIDENKTITEIMLVWESSDAGGHQLDVTHSRIYDEHGNVSSFVKRINEKTTVTVYVGIVMNVGSAINTLWTNNNYTVINPYLYLKTIVTGIDISREGLCRLYDRFTHTCITDNDINLFNTKNLSEGSVYGVISQSTPKLYEEGWVSKFLLKDSNSTHRSIVSIVDHSKNIHLSTAESIEVTALSNFNDNTFSDSLWAYCTNNNKTLQTYPNYRARLQIDQITPSHMQMYNHNSHQWVDEDFDTDSSFIYDTSFVYSVYYKTILNDNPIEVWIYPNSKAGIYDILSFNTSAVHVWATDTYWDSSSWVEITKTEVESTYRNKRFYICSSNTSLTPNYDYTCLQLDNVNTGYTIENSGIVINRTGKKQTEIIPDPNCNCIIGFNKIIYPDDPTNVVSYPIQNYGNLDCDGEVDVYTSSSTSSIGIFKITEDGDRLIMAHKCRTVYGESNDNYAAGCYRIYTISDDKTVAPTYVDVQIPFTSQLYNVPTFHSFTDQGYVVTVHNNDQEIGIIDLYANSGEETSVISGMWGIALNRTTLCVYRDSSDLSALIFKVYDMSTSTITKTFVINGDYIMNGITGWKNHVYIRVYDQTNERYTIIYYNITTDESANIGDPVSTTSATHPFNTHPSGIWDNGFRSCDECFVFPSQLESTSAEDPYYNKPVPFITILSNDPTNLRDLKTEMNLSVLNTFGRFSTNTDGSFVGLEIENNIESSDIDSQYPVNSPISNTDRSGCLLDIGDLYDNNHIDITHTYNTTFPYNNCIDHTAYKEYDIIIDGSTLVFNPLRRSRIHKIIGTTTTIQTINNPKRVQAMDTFTLKIQRS